MYQPPWRTLSSLLVLTITPQVGATTEGTQEGYQRVTQFSMALKNVFNSLMDLWTRGNI